MQIYITKNNQQSGPFEEVQVLEMLRSGQVSPNDLGFRQDSRQWQPLREMFQISAPSPSQNNPTTQNIGSWAKQNIQSQIFVQYKPASSRLIGYLITLFLIGVLPVLAGFILRTFFNAYPLGNILMVIGGFLFVLFLFIFGLLFLVHYFRQKKFADVFNSQGVVTKNKVLYEWEKLQYVNFIKFRNNAVHGQGIIPMLISMLVIHLFRQATLKDERQKSFDGAELVFANGKVILPTTMKNFGEIWDFIEKVPVQPRLDGDFNQKTMAELQKCGLYNKTQSQPAASPNPQLPTGQINQPASQFNTPQPPPGQIIQTPPAQLNAPTAAKKSKGIWILAGVLIAGLLLVGAAGLIAGLYFYLGSRTANIVSNSNSNRNGNRNANSNSSQTLNEAQTFPDASPDKKPDFTMTAEEFHLDAGDYSKEKQALAKYGGKIVQILGRVYLFQSFDGKRLFFKTSGSYLGANLLDGEAAKIPNIKEAERIKVKCDVVDDLGVKLKNCAVLERQPAVTADEKPDFSLSAKDFYEQVENSKLSYETRKKNRAKYFGKVIEISGKVRNIGGDGYFLAVSERQLADVLSR